MTGEYAFVVGMQFDTGQEDASPEKLRLLDTFFSLLPDTVMSSIDNTKFPLIRQPTLINTTIDRDLSRSNSNNHSPMVSKFIKATSSISCQLEEKEKDSSIIA